LAYSHNLNRTNGGAFMVLVFLWVRAHGVGASVTFQTDWGEEFGGDNQEQIQKLGARFLAPLHGTLCRYPMCRKGYHGRVERSHRTDDEEFYHPYLLQIGDTPSFLSWAARRAYFYNVLRPHFGSDMGESTSPCSRRSSSMPSAPISSWLVTPRMVTIYSPSTGPSLL